MRTSEAARTEATAAADAAKRRKLAAVSADRVGLGGPDTEMVERTTYLLCGATPQAAASLPVLLAKVVHGQPSRRMRHDFRNRSLSRLLDQGQRRGNARARPTGNQAQWQTISDDLDQTTREVANMHEEIIAAFRSLVADGIILPDAFRRFPRAWDSVGDRQAMIGGVTPGQEALRLTLLISARRD